MNDKIKQLWEKAATASAAYPSGQNNSWEGQTRFIEKFAQLIVRECMRELEISRKCDPYTGEMFNCEYNTCINEQTTVLKEHFGVEE